MAEKKKSEKKIKPKSETKEIDADAGHDKGMKKSDYYLLISIGIIILLLAAIIVIPKFIKEKPVEEVMIKSFNGYIFEKFGTIWATTVNVHDKSNNLTNSYQIMFHFTPDDVENITSAYENSTSLAAKEIINAKQVYLTFDPDAPGEFKSLVAISGVEIVKIVSIIYGKPVKTATTKEIGLSNTPVVSCNNATAFVKVIYLTQGNETGLSLRDGCIIVSGKDSASLLKAAERLSFELLRIF